MMLTLNAALGIWLLLPSIVKKNMMIFKNYWSVDCLLTNLLIGINRKFAWILNGKSIIPSLWCGDCPNNTDNNENCVQIWGLEHGLNDVHCNWESGFICEDRIKKIDHQDKKSYFIFNFIQNKSFTLRENVQKYLLCLPILLIFGIYIPYGVI